MKTQFYFFSGKGGVGKTTMASSSAIHYAGQGKKTLIITTDPASNLADVFEQPIGHKITQITGINNLFAMELDPDKATAEYKERTLSPLRGLIPAESFAVLEEQLNSPCTAEMAAFDRFTDFLGVSEFEIVIFDTAPTGHTLRLLQLPVQWSGVIETAAKDGNGGQTCIGPAAALSQSKAKFDKAIEAMKDSGQTTFIFVLRPEATSIYEVKRALAELSKLGIHSQELIVNGIYPYEVCDNPFMLNRFAKQQAFLAQIKQEFSQPTYLMQLGENEVKGKEALFETGKKLLENPARLADYTPKVVNADPVQMRPVFPLINKDIEKLLTPKDGQRRTIFFAGKGGVGKTSVSAATALWVSGKGYKTLLLTTDPASHLGEIFKQEVTGEPTPIKGENNLWVARIDTLSATQNYKENILAEAREKFDAQRVIAIEEELNSPCTEEMATFEKFIEFMTLQDYEVIIFDTAPTGHTLRLLELPVDWNKQLEIKTYATTGETAVDKATKSKFAQVINMMQDPDKTTFSFVLYPEATPIEEAFRAIKELESINVKTNMIVANFILSRTIITNSFLKKRQAMQNKYLNQMDNRFTASVVKLEQLPDDLMGRDKLKQAGDLLYGVEK